jgi:hypothetical protein
LVITGGETQENRALPAIRFYDAKTVEAALDAAGVSNAEFAAAVSNICVPVRQPRSLLTEQH